MPKKITWNDIINSIGKPIYDKENQRWRVLISYKRFDNDYYIQFTDNNNDYNFKSLNLYNKEYKEEIKNNE